MSLRSSLVRLYPSLANTVSTGTKSLYIFLQCSQLSTWDLSKYRLNGSILFTSTALKVCKSLLTVSVESLGIIFSTSYSTTGTSCSICTVSSFQQTYKAASPFLTQSSSTLSSVEIKSILYQS